MSKLFDRSGNCQHLHDHHESNVDKRSKEGESEVGMSKGGGGYTLEPCLHGLD